jgi:hypothetical protein
LQLNVLDDSQNCQKLGAATLDLWSQFHSEYQASAPALGVISSIPIGRNPGPSGPANLQAMGHLIRKNVFHRSLTHYILDRSIVTKKVLKWHDTIIFIGVQTLPPTPLPIVRQRCVLNVSFGSAPPCISSYLREWLRQRPWILAH